jgi:hypothetical protein
MCSVGEATVWNPNVDPEMENAVKKHSGMHNQIHLVVRRKRRPPDREMGEGG